MKSSLWYLRDGSPIFPEGTESLSKEWHEGMKKMEEKLQDPAYKVVKQQTLWWGGWVSTVWIGLDMSYIPHEKPIIFETMVFRNKRDFDEMDMERYSTEEEAWAGHKAMVKKWNNPLLVLRRYYSAWKHSRDIKAFLKRRGMAND
jgi:hypothetical protein